MATESAPQLLRKLRRAAGYSTLKAGARAIALAGFERPGEALLGAMERGDRAITDESIEAVMTAWRLSPGDRAALERAREAGEAGRTEHAELMAALSDLRDEIVEWRGLTREVLTEVHNIRTYLEQHNRNRDR